MFPVLEKATLFAVDLFPQQIDFPLQITPQTYQPSG